MLQSTQLRSILVILTLTISLPTKPMTSNYDPKYLLVGSTGLVILTYCAYNLLIKIIFPIKKSRSVENYNPQAASQDITPKLVEKANNKKLDDIVEFIETHRNDRITDWQTISCRDVIYTKNPTTADDWFHIALTNKDFSCATFFLNEGANIDYIYRSNRHYNSESRLAHFYEDLDTAKFLITNGADINTTIYPGVGRPKYEIIPLFLQVISEEKYNIAELFIQRKESLDIKAILETCTTAETANYRDMLLLYLATKNSSLYNPNQHIDYHKRITEDYQNDVTTFNPIFDDVQSAQIDRYIKQANKSLTQKAWNPCCLI